MIKAIVFDYVGVIELPLGDVIQEIINIVKVTKSEWKQQYNCNVYLCNNGKKSWEEVILLTANQFTKSLEELEKIKELLILSEKNKKINFDLLDLIKFLKNKGYKTGLLSNFTAGLKCRLQNQNILNFFDVVIASGEVGYQKPDVEIFKILVDRLQINLDELLFIDDSEKSFVNSTKLNFIPLLFTNNDDVREKILQICNLNLKNKF